MDIEEELRRGVIGTMVSFANRTMTRGADEIAGLRARLEAADESARLRDEGLRLCEHYTPEKRGCVCECREEGTGERDE